jgi:hypothetical protein
MPIDQQEVRAMPAEPAAAADTSANPHLGAVVSLPEFNAMAGTLSEAERRTLVNQALVLIDDLYVHLPLKRAAHAVDPVQQLKLLRRRLGTLSERQFHDEMISIFKRLRDLHTNYILPAPYNQHTAFLPFLMEEFYDSAGERRYIVTRLLQASPIRRSRLAWRSYAGAACRSSVRSRSMPTARPAATKPPDTCAASTI